MIIKVYSNAKRERTVNIDIIICNKRNTEG